MARLQNLISRCKPGEGDGLIFYAREHPAGASLPERLQKANPLEDLALQTIIHVGEAITKKNNIPHLPLTIDQVLIPDTGVPKLLTNVSGAGDEVSEGEWYEMFPCSDHPPGHGRAAVITEYESILQRMETAGEGGFSTGIFEGASTPEPQCRGAPLRPGKLAVTPPLQASH